MRDRETERGGGREKEIDVERGRQIDRIDRQNANIGQNDICIFINRQIDKLFALCSKLWQECCSNVCLCLHLLPFVGSRETINILISIYDQRNPGWGISQLLFDYSLQQWLFAMYACINISQIHMYLANHPSEMKIIVLVFFGIFLMIYHKYSSQIERR